ncbi:hypothetical protein [Sphingomonas xanthus]|nr:hypothetical protein [Sphingomonas xanthus]
MTAKFLFGPAAAAMMLTTPAFGQAATAAGQTQAARAADDNRLICKKEAPTGTRFGKRVCHTKAEWDQIRAQSQRDAKEMIDRPKIDDSRG